MNSRKKPTDEELEACKETLRFFRDFWSQSCFNAERDAKQYDAMLVELPWDMSDFDEMVEEFRNDGMTVSDSDFE